MFLHDKFLIFSLSFCFSIMYASLEDQLVLAVTRGSKRRVQRLSKAGVNVNKAGIFGWTPLHRASSKGHAQIVQRLLEAGAKVDCRDNNGWTPLHKAAYKKHKRIVALLLDAGAEPSPVNNQGDTPLHLDKSSFRSKITERLLDAGADIHAMNNKGHTVFDCMILCLEPINSFRAYLLASRGADIPSFPVQGHMTKVFKFSLLKKQRKCHQAMFLMIDNIWVERYHLPEALVCLTASFIGGNQLLAAIENRNN